MRAVVCGKNSHQNHPAVSSILTEYRSLTCSYQSMKHFQGLFQAAVLVLLLFSTPAQGNGKALWDWLYSAEDVTVSGSSNLPNSYDRTEVLDNVLRIEQTGKTEAAKAEDMNMLRLYTGGDPGIDVDKSLLTTTNFLPWGANQAMYMTMDHEKWGNWFITAPLSGCDVWLAARDGAEPLAIHINANKYSEQPLENLEYKQNLAVQALNYFNNEIVQGDKYHFILRTSYDFFNDPHTSDSQKDEVAEYWNSFKAANPNVVPIFYLGSGFFYGTYNVLTTLEQWDFALKDLIGGHVIGPIGCSVPKGCCNC